MARANPRKDELPGPVSPVELGKSDAMSSRVLPVAIAAGMALNALSKRAVAASKFIFRQILIGRVIGLPPLSINEARREKRFSATDYIMHRISLPELQISNSLTSGFSTPFFFFFFLHNVLP